MVCRLDTQLNGETLYMYDEYPDGNPYVLRSDGWYEVNWARGENFRYTHNPYLPQDSGEAEPEGIMYRMTEVSQHDVEMWDWLRSQDS